MQRFRLVYLALALLILAADVVRGQEARREPLTTKVRFEILLAPRTTSIDAQRWGPVFQKLGESARFRQPILDDRPEVTETRQGRTRLVKAVGELKPDGSLAFPGRSFRLTETRELAEWIRELKTYGAQGSPAGKRGFGLSATQLDLVLRMLEAPMTKDVTGLPLEQAVRQFGLPPTLPLRFSVDAEQDMQKLPVAVTAPADLRGLSRGTVLAILLSRANLGFRPSRTPVGSLELVALPLEPDAGLWPIGWPLDRPPVHVVPKYVETEIFDLMDEPLTSLLDDAKKQAGVRILVDVHRIADAELSLDLVKVTQRPRRMTWSGMLDRATFPDLMPELLQDEAGKPFVWITTRTTAQLSDRAEQREARAKAGR